MLRQCLPQKFHVKSPAIFWCGFPSYHVTPYIYLSQKIIRTGERERGEGGGVNLTSGRSYLSQGLIAWIMHHYAIPLLDERLRERFADDWWVPETWPGKTGRCIPQRQRILRYFLALCFRYTGC